MNRHVYIGLSESLRTCPLLDGIRAGRAWLAGLGDEEYAELLDVLEAAPAASIIYHCLRRLGAPETVDREWRQYLFVAPGHRLMFRQ